MLLASTIHHITVNHYIKVSGFSTVHTVTAHNCTLAAMPALALEALASLSALAVEALAALALALDALAAVTALALAALHCSKEQGAGN